MDKAKLLQDAITLFVVINPFGAVPLYLAITRGMTRPQRLRAALRACIIAAVILLVFIAVGEIVLDGMGVRLTAFRAAGGLILLLVALRMVLNTENRHPFAAQEATSGNRPDIAVFPLATPFLAGPGAIMAAVLLTENGRFSIPEQALTGVIVVVILALTFAILACADLLQHRIGTTGSMVMSRVLGLVLAALATQTMLEGLRPFFASIR
jgi:multiple antibiotic resistance protein